MSDREVRDKLIELGYLAPNQVFLDCYADKKIAASGLIAQIRSLINSISKQRYLAIGENRSLSSIKNTGCWKNILFRRSWKSTWTERWRNASR